jgi:hypothetical protein
VATPAFAPTGAWTNWATADVPANLNAGANTIRLAATTAAGAANADYVDVSAASSATDYQAEDCTISQGVVESNWPGFTGTGFVNGDNVVGSAVECAVTGPATSLAVRFANGTTTNRPMSLAVDGTTVATLNFPGTGAWSTWGVTSVPVSLGVGSHQIRLTATTSNGGPNLDRITIT